MDPQQKHFRMLLAAALLCLFVGADSYLVPLRARREQVVDLQSFSSGRRARSYYVYTHAAELSVGSGLFAVLRSGDSIEVFRSALTGVPQQVSRGRGAVRFTSPVGFLRVGTGIVYVPLLLVVIGGFRLLYRKIDSPRGKRDFTYFLLVSSVLLVFFYSNIRLY